MPDITLSWQGHSCFTLEKDGSILVLDPYDGDMIGYPQLAVKAHAMLASHQHGDHNYEAAISRQTADHDVLVQVDELPEMTEPGVFCWKAVETDHDEAGGTKRGKNLVHVIRAGNLTLAHLGDLGHILKPDQVEAIGPVDILLVPVGGHFTIDAQQAWDVIDQIRPKTVVPMHYNPGFSSLPIESVTPFLKMKDEDFTIEQLDGNIIELDRAPERRILVFNFEE